MYKSESLLIAVVTALKMSRSYDAPAVPVAVKVCDCLQAFVSLPSQVKTDGLSANLGDADVRRSVSVAGEPSLFKSGQQGVALKLTGKPGTIVASFGANSMSGKWSARTTDTMPASAMNSRRMCLLRPHGYGYGYTKSVQINSLHPEFA